VWILLLNPDGTVKSQQKISGTQGGFSGTIDDADWFGYAVASLGDLDGDGMGELAVGAVGDDDGGSDRGALWILSLNPSGTVKSHRKISSTQGGFTGTLDGSDCVGGNVASLGNLLGDGVGDLAVSAEGDDDGGPDRGAVWILFLDGAFCSDGFLDTGEQCDDGNIADADGCDHICQIEVEDTWELFGIAKGGTIGFHVNYLESDVSLDIYEDMNSNGSFDPGEERDGGIGGDGGSVFEYAFDLDASVSDLGGVSIDLFLTTYDDSFDIDINGVAVVPVDPGNPALFTPEINRPWLANSNGHPRLHITLTEASIDFEGSETASSATMTTGLVYDQPTTNPVFFDGQNTITIVNPNGRGPDAIDFQIRLTVAFEVHDVALQVTARAGETAADIAAKVADAINGDPTLSQAGIYAFATGNTVITNGTITDRPEPIEVPGLTGWGLGLLAVLLLLAAAMTLGSASRARFALQREARR
jgi:cysteine-rich repeat protein